ncbi:hypothetical protein F4775DRAFT_595320 [Biscogniauxia sp. FL1348]|nr:hypothetical protein F4775DRAFT_595320 [Biscogniauxia sp. FL1348]
MGYLRESGNGKSTTRNVKAHADRRTSGYSSCSSLHGKPSGVKKHKHRSKKLTSERLSEYAQNELRLRGGFVEFAPFLIHIFKLMAQGAFSSSTEAVQQEAFRKAVVIKPDDWLDIIKMMKGSGLLVGAVEAVKEIGTKMGSVLDVPGPVIEQLSSEPSLLSAAINMLGIEFGPSAPYAAFGAAMVLLLASAVIGKKLWQTISSSGSNSSTEKPESPIIKLLTENGKGKTLSEIFGTADAKKVPEEDALKVEAKKLLELSEGLDHRRDEVSQMLQDVEKRAKKLASDREKRAKKLDIALEKLAQELAAAEEEGAQAKGESPDLWSLISSGAPAKSAKKAPEGSKLLHVRRVPACPHKLHEGVWDCLAFACLVPCSECGVVLGQPPAKKSKGTFVCADCGGGKQAPQTGKTRKIPACPSGQHDGIVECLANKCLDPCASCRVSLFKSTKNGPVVCLKCRIEDAGLEKPSEGKASKKRKSSDEHESEDDSQPKKKSKHANKPKAPKTKAPKTKTPKTKFPIVVPSPKPSPFYPGLSPWGQQWLMGNQTN